MTRFHSQHIIDQNKPFFTNIILWIFGCKAFLETNRNFLPHYTSCILKCGNILYLPSSPYRGEQRNSKGGGGRRTVAPPPLYAYDPLHSHILGNSVPLFLQHGYSLPWLLRWKPDTRGSETFFRFCLRLTEEWKNCGKPTQEFLGSHVCTCTSIWTICCRSFMTNIILWTQFRRDINIVHAFYRQGWNICTHYICAIMSRKNVWVE